MKYTIDAQNKRIGRIATEVATLLMGKNHADFARNVVPDTTVEVINSSKIDLDSKKARNTVKTRYSGHPGGLISEPLIKIAEKKGYGELIRIAVLGMLPKNKLQSKMIRNLTVSE